MELYFDTSAIKPAIGYAFKGIEVEPQTVEVSGSPEILDKITRLDIKADVLAKTDISKNEEVVIDLTEHLPEGIILVEENKSVVVRIILEEAGTKSILLPVGAVTVKNAPNNLQLSYGPEQEVELKFEGSSEVLEELTSDKITATIDLTQCKEKGTYDIPVLVTGLPQQCSYIGKATIQIVLSPKTE